MSNYVKLSNVQGELNNLREQGVRAGHGLGFGSWVDLFTIKKGYPVFIAGAPHDGKTEVLLEILMQLSELHGWRHLVYSGETGTAEEIFAELCHKYIGKPYRKIKPDGEINPYAMTDDERMEAEVWVADHFVVIDTEHKLCQFKEFDIYTFYKNVSDIENELGITFDTTSIDPYNDMDENLSKYGGRQDLYLKDSLMHCRRDCKINNRVNFIVNHISDIKPVTDKSSGKRFYPPALPNEWYGGKIWFRRGFLMLLVYRPPTFLNSPDTGEPYHNNECIIEVQKAKPKGIGKLGRVSIFWDWKRNRYYEYDDTNMERYSRENPPKLLINL